MALPLPPSVEEACAQKLTETIHPWPTIPADPIPWRDDGRFAKAFPLTFVTGVGDYHQPRHRDDFSLLEWVQHIFRFYTGHVQSSMRGNRVLWTALDTNRWY